MRRLLHQTGGLFSSLLFSCLVIVGGLTSPRIPTQWEFVGPKNIQPPFSFGFGQGKIAGRVSSAAFDPLDDQKLYVATPGGGLFKTVDGGLTWMSLSDGWQGLSTSCVAVDPSNPDVIYAGTGDYDGDSGSPTGLMKSIDGGETWTNFGQGQLGGSAVRRLLIDPENSQILIAIGGRGPNGLGQVYRSANGGSSWAPVINVSASWSDVSASAKFGSSRYYFAVAGGSNAQLWRSSDRGLTWVQVAAPLRTGVSLNDTADLAASPTNASTLYLLGSGDQKIWRTINAGFSWAEITGTTFDPIEWQAAKSCFSLSCSSVNGQDVVYAGLADLKQSVNGGASWRSFGGVFSGSDLVHSNQHDFVISPIDPNVGLACTEGGIYRIHYNPTNQTWASISLNSNLPVTQVAAMDMHPDDETKLLVGAIGNGTIACLGDLDVWTGVLGGSGTSALINPQSPDTQYSTYAYLGAGPIGGIIGINRTTNAWNTHQYVTANVGNDLVDANAPVVMDPADPTVIYAGTNYLYKYQDGLSPAWTARVGGQKLAQSGVLTSLAISRLDHRIIYSGSDGGEIYLSRDSGATWSRIDNSLIGLPDARVSDIDVLDQNPNDVLVSFEGPTGHSLWRCFDTSAESPTWISVSGNGVSGLPNSAVYCIQRDSLLPQSTWFVGTDRGVFKTTDNGSSWLNITQPLKLPPVAVKTFLLRNGYLYAGTLGRGIWRLQINADVAGLVGFQIQPSQVVGPADVTATVALSTPAPTGGATVTMTADHPEAANVPTSMTIPAGGTVGTFSIAARSVMMPTIVTIQATYNGSSRSETLTVNPSGLYSLEFNPESLRGGEATTATLRTGVPAGSGGATVSLSSLNPSALEVPSSVTIPEGQTSLTFMVSANPVSVDTAVTVNASLDGSKVSKDVTVTSPRIAMLAFSPPTIVGGQTATGTVSLDADAPAGGMSVSLSGSNPGALTVPGFVVVPAGSRTASFTVSSHPVQVDSSVTVTAMASGESRDAGIQVRAQRLNTLTFNPNPAIGGSVATGRVELLGPAVTATTIHLVTLNGAVANVPSTVTIQQGQIGANFNVTTQMVSVDSVATIRAIYGTQSLDRQLTVSPLRLTSFILSPNAVLEGQTITGTVALNGPAPAGGITVSIANSNSATASLPSSITIPQGQTTKTFSVLAKSVSAVQTSTVKATRGTVSILQTLTVSPVGVLSVSLSQQSVVGGTNFTGVVNLASAAPVGGARVNLTSSNTALATVPASITVPAGQVSGSFTVTSKPVAALSFLTITATRGATSRSASFQIRPPDVNAFTLSSYNVKGGTRVNATVRLNGKAPVGGMPITITSVPGLVSPVGNVRVSQNGTSVNFQLQTAAVASQTAVTLTARAGSTPFSIQLTLRP